MDLILTEVCDSMKNENVSAILFYTAAILFDSAAIISFIGGNNNSNGVMWLCFGSMFLCLGSSYSKKSKKNEGKQDDKEKRDK